MSDSDNTYYDPIEVADERYWCLNTDIEPLIALDEDYYVAVPVQDIVTMTDPQLIFSLRMCITQLPHVQANGIASKVLSGLHDDEYRYYLGRLLPHRGSDDNVDLAIDFLIERIEKDDARYPKRVPVNKLRAEVANRYDKLFMKIGRRDGFQCAKCNSTRNLQIDHIRPVSIGGSNDLENLQFLCGSCNSSKGATEVDYRVTGGVS